MNSTKKIILTSVILIGLTVGLCSCIGYVGGPGYYGHGWYHDGPWMDGPHGYVGVGVHPMR